MVWLFIVKCLYLMVPAYAANMAPVMFRNHLKSLAVPVDFGVKFRGQPLLGPHKTIRGFVAGVALAILASFLQFLLKDNPFIMSISLIEYGNWMMVGFLLGSGALLGDMAKSVVKRQLKIPSGSPFIPFDQLDFAVGALAFMSIAQSISLQVILSSMALSFFLHIATNHVAYWLKIRKEKW